MKLIISVLPCLVLFIIVSFTGCSGETPKASLIGSWYCKQDIVGYSELYFSDSLCSAQSETRYVPEERYYIKNDSIYIKDKYSTEPFSFCKIIKMKDDTLLLEMKDHEIKGTELWIRFPKDEFGRFDMKNSTEDSLADKTRLNYDRRKRRFYAIESDDFKEYDSLIGIGYWEWNTRTQKRIFDERMQNVEDRLNELEKRIK